MSSEINETGINHSFAPDVLSEAMIATASDYFLGNICGAESSVDFRQTIHNFYSNRTPIEGQMIMAAGLLALGFSVKTEPLTVCAPGVAPDEALPTDLFLHNWYHVSATIIEAGINATTPTKPEYCHDITDRVLKLSLAVALKR